MGNFRVPGIDPADVVCKCDDPFCAGKIYNPERRPRTHKMLEMAGALIASVPFDVEITSCQRCEAHNAAVGGASDSAHVHNCAIDLKPKGPLYDLALAASAQNWWSAILIYGGTQGGFLHLDVHPNERVIRGWSLLKGKNHFLNYGQRGCSGPLEPIFAWNKDELTTRIPSYIPPAPAEVAVAEVNDADEG